MQLRLLLTASLWSVLFWRQDGISSAAEPGYLDFDNLPETNFSCESKVIGGYYADVETGCQMFHVCTIGQKGEITDIKFLCLNGTAFDQETRVCERLDEVDCSRTESFFDLNLQLYGNKAHGFGGIEPENEEPAAEEECDPDEDEECQKPDDGEEGEEAGVQQTTFSPTPPPPPAAATTAHPPPPAAAAATTSDRAPAGHHHHHHQLQQQQQQQQQQFPSDASPDTIAALLALHNAFTQSLQHHDISNREQQLQQKQQQRQQIEQQRQQIHEQQLQIHRQQQLQQRQQQQQIQQQQKQIQQARPPPPAAPPKPSSFQPPHRFPPPSPAGHFPLQQLQSFEPAKTPAAAAAGQQQQQQPDRYRLPVPPFPAGQQRFPAQPFPHHRQPPPPPPPLTERPKPFSFHQQYEPQPQGTSSPYLLHQLKVDRVKQEQHAAFPRQAAQRHLPPPTPAVAVVTSTSTTTSVRAAGNKHAPPLRADPFAPPAENRTAAPAAPASYDEYQEGDVQVDDPFFRDVPKIGRKRRAVAATPKDTVVADRLSKEAYRIRRSLEPDLALDTDREKKMPNENSRIANCGAREYRAVMWSDVRDVPAAEEFAEIIDSVQRTISARVAGIRRRGARAEDGLRLSSAEERRLLSEVSDVVRKHSPPEGGVRRAAAPPPAFSARDKHRLGLFVTSKQKRQKKLYLAKNSKRKRRQAADNGKARRQQTRYEVSEVVDEPTTEAPLAGRLIGRYRSDSAVRPAPNATHTDDVHPRRRKTHRPQQEEARAETLKTPSGIVSPQGNFERFEAAQQLQSRNTNTADAGRHRMAAARQQEHPRSNSTTLVAFPRRLSGAAVLRSDLERPSSSEAGGESARKRIPSVHETQQRQSYEVDDERSARTQAAAHKAHGGGAAGAEREEERQASTRPDFKQRTAAGNENSNFKTAPDETQNPKLLSERTRERPHSAGSNYHLEDSSPVEPPSPPPPPSVSDSRTRKTVRRRPASRKENTETRPVVAGFQPRRRPATSRDSTDANVFVEPVTILPEFKSRRRPAARKSEPHVRPTTEQSRSKPVGRAPPVPRGGSKSNPPPAAAFSGEEDESPVPRPKANAGPEVVPAGTETSTALADGAGRPSAVAPETPGVRFSCEGKIKGGFYADMESDCRGFFICSQGEINGPLLKSHFWCGQATKFNQRSRTCQADYLVECSISPRYFSLNNDFAVPSKPPDETDTFEPKKI